MALGLAVPEVPRESWVIFGSQSVLNVLYCFEICRFPSAIQVPVASWGLLGVLHSFRMSLELGVLGVSRIQAVPCFILVFQFLMGSLGHYWLWDLRCPENLVAM